MTENGESFLADQRYYHFAVIRAPRDFRVSDCWRQLGDMVVPKRPLNFTSPDFEVQHRKIRSEKGYARGIVAQSLSAKGNGRPPYLYDVFAARVDVGAEVYCALGFPFLNLGVEIVQGMQSNRRPQKANEFVGVDVGKLVSLAETGIPEFRELYSRVVGVQFVVTDDKSLAAVRLGGDSPLSAQIYLEFLRAKVRAKYFLPDNCVIACARELQHGAGEPHRILRTRIHLNGYGHFKFYLHVGCTNLPIIPYAIGQLHSTSTLQRVLGNPLVREAQEGAE